jgi:serine/threonine protein kinase
VDLGIADIATTFRGHLGHLRGHFGQPARVDDTAGLTATNMAIGTVAYAAPEQLMGEAVDACADQYALACTAFHLLTGAAPYDYPSAPVVITKHVTAPPPSIGERRPELTGLDPVFAKAMAKTPADRFARCQDFTEELQRRLATAPIPIPVTEAAPIPLPVTEAAPIPVQETPIPVQETQPTPIHVQDTRLAPIAPALVPQPPPGPPGPPQAPVARSTLKQRVRRQPAGGRNPRLGRRRNVAIGLAAAIVLATSIAIAAVVVHSNTAGKNSGAEVSTPGPTASVSSNSPAPPTSSTPPSANPTPAPMSLNGAWSGPVSGDQTDFDVVAEIHDGATLTGTVSYPQLNCAGTWTQHGSAGNGTRLITERITQGPCVTAEVTPTPQNDGTLYFTSTYYAASKKRYITIYATMRR